MLSILKTVLVALVVVLSGQSVLAGEQNGRPRDHGPQVTAFLEFLRAEEEELEFQIRHNEISRRDYLRARNRFAVIRTAVLEIVDSTGEDIVPEIHAVTMSEIDQIIEGGAELIRGLKPGDVVAERWRYHGPAVRGETFHVFERVSQR